MDTAKIQDLLNKKQNNTKQWILLKKQDLLNEKAEQYKIVDTAKKTRSVKQKSRTRQNNGCY